MDKFLIVNQRTGQFAIWYNVGKNEWTEQSLLEESGFIFSDDMIEKKVCSTEELLKDNVNHPSHYSGKIECIEAMEAAFGKESVKNFCRCNAFKYLWRAGKKDNVKQDLEKAVWYINKEIELQ